jgi:hypothetical protein
LTEGHPVFLEKINQYCFEDKVALIGSSKWAKSSAGICISARLFTSKRQERKLLSIHFCHTIPKQEEMEANSPIWMFSDVC